MITLYLKAPLIASVPIITTTGKNNGINFVLKDNYTEHTNTEQLHGYLKVKPDHSEA